MRFSYFFKLGFAGEAKTDSGPGKPGYNTNSYFILRHFLEEEILKNKVEVLSSLSLLGNFT